MWIAPWIIFYLCIVHTEQQPKGFKFKGYHWSYYNDHMSVEDKTKMREMSLNLIYKMKLRNRQLLPIKMFHVNKMSYQVGLVIGTLREKYRRMMDTYLEMRRRYFGQTRILGPGLWENLPMHYELAMGVVRRLEVEIHNYIDLLQTIPEDMLEEGDKLRNSAAFNPAVPAGKKPGGKMPSTGRCGRQGNYTQPDTGGVHFVNSSSSSTPTDMTQKKLTEEDIKRAYRENYMKEQGMAGADWSVDGSFGFK